MPNLSNVGFARMQLTDLLRQLGTAEKDGIYLTPEKVGIWKRKLERALQTYDEHLGEGTDQDGTTPTR